MSGILRSLQSNLGRNIRRQFITGLFVVIPLSVTILILVWVFSAVDGVLQPLIQLVMGRRIPGIGFGVTIILIYIAGLLTTNIGGRKLIGFGEYLLSKVPIVRMLYKSIKQIMESFSSSGKSGFLQTVLVEFPRKDIWTIGFITNESKLQSGENHLNIFIPTAPNPTSGFLQIATEKEIIRTGIPIDEALKMVISAGNMSPPGLNSIINERIMSRDSAQ